MFAEVDIALKNQRLVFVIQNINFYQTILVQRKERYITPTESILSGYFYILERYWGGTDFVSHIPLPVL